MKEQFCQVPAPGGALFARVWQPEGKARAVVCIVHGMGEHGGRYADVARALTEHGYAVFAADHRGHGQSPGRRGDIPSYPVMLDDVARMLEAAGEQAEGPLFLYGHSMGGNLAVNFALDERARMLSGVIVTSPWLKLHEKSERQLRLAGIVAKVLPMLSMNNGIDARGLCRDARIVSAYQQDVLVHGKISPRMAAAISRAGRFALAHAQDLKVPMLLMHGLNDPITLPAASEQFYMRAPQQMCTYVSWPGCLHELHNENDRDAVLSQIIGFLDEHAKDHHPSQEQTRKEQMC